MKLAVSGCSRNCAESYVKDVGVVAIEGGRWEIYIGAQPSAHPQGRSAHHVRRPRAGQDAGRRFMQYYRENAKWLERTYAFVPRIGLDKIRAIVVDDSEGIAADLDARNLDRRLCRSLAGPRYPSGSRPIPDLAAPGGAAEGADPQRAGRAGCRPGRTAGPGLGGSASVTAPTLDRAPARPGRPDPMGEGRAFGVGGDQVAVFRSATAEFVPFPPCAHIAVGHLQMVRSTARS